MCGLLAHFVSVVTGMLAICVQPRRYKKLLFLLIWGNYFCIQVFLGWFSKWSKNFVQIHLVLMLMISKQFCEGNKKLKWRRYFLEFQYNVFFRVTLFLYVYISNALWVDGGFGFFFTVITWMRCWESYSNRVRPLRHPSRASSRTGSVRATPRWIERSCVRLPCTHIQ